MPHTQKSTDEAIGGQTEELRLHIGGKEPREGWKIFNIQEGPNIDFTGNCRDLGRFDDGSVQEIYASHVLEHLSYQNDILAALTEMHRVLCKGGRLMVSVPDFDALIRIFQHPDLSTDHRFYIMRVIFGGQMDRHDFHHAGLSMEFLSYFMIKAGFDRVERVQEFGLFKDASVMKIFGDNPISLNVEAYK